MSDYPYIGLRPFSKNDNDIFFGRKQHTIELIKRLSSNNFLAVLGVSGCGKSSLVKCGLIAGLESGFLPSSSSYWHIIDIKPGNNPFKALAMELLKVIPSLDYTLESLQTLLRQTGSLSLHELFIRHPLPDNGQLLIICDQFEEIFYCNEIESAAFIELLLASAKCYPLSNGNISNNIYIVLTLRSNSLGNCASYAGLSNAINSSLFLTPPLTHDQLREAIEAPSLLFGGDIEPELVVRLMEDVQGIEDGLPLLQHILMRLWRHSEDKTLKLDDYVKLGGLKNALTNHIDLVFSKLSYEQKIQAEKLFTLLVASDENQKYIRHPIKIRDFIKYTDASYDDATFIVESFRAEGRNFLLPNPATILTQDTEINISHESLIRQWALLQEWVDKEAKSVDTYLRLSDYAQRFTEKKVSLLKTPELEIFSNWYQAFKPSKIWASRYDSNFDSAVEFLVKSKKDHTLDLIKKRSLIIFVVQILLVAVGIYYQKSLELESINKDLLQAKSTLEKTNDQLKQTINEKDEKQQKLQRANFINKKLIQNIINSDSRFKKHPGSLYNNINDKELINEAINIYKEQVKSDPNDYFAWFGLGDVYAINNQPDESIGAYKNAVRIDPNSSLAWFYMGDIYRSKNDTKNAIEAYSRVVSIDKFSKWAWYYLGSMYEKENDYENAIINYIKQTNISKNHLASWYHLGGIYLKQNKIKKAIFAFKNSQDFSDSRKILSNLNALQSTKSITSKNQPKQGEYKNANNRKH